MTPFSHKSRSGRPTCQEDNLQSGSAHHRSSSRPTIGVFLVNYSDFWFLLWMELVEKARELDVNLHTFVGRELKAVRGFPEQENLIYSLACPETLDGLIVMGGLGNDVSKSVVESFCHQYSRVIPAVSLLTPVDGISAVLLDSMAGWRRALEHLIVDHGYQRVAIVTGPEHNYEAQKRYQVYLDVLAENGLPFDPELVLPGDFSIEMGREAAEMLLKRNVKGDALAASNDHMASGALQVLRERGIRVPYDLALIGFDDIPGSQYEFPPLTTVRLSFVEAARESLILVMAKVRGETLERDIILDAELVIRQSCGCPSRAVSQAEIDDISSQLVTMGASFELPRAEQRAQVIQELDRLLFSRAPAGAGFTWTARLFDAFVEELRYGQTGDFVPLLKEFLSTWVSGGKNVDAWQELVSTFRRRMLPFMKGSETLLQAGRLWQQARLLIDEAANQARMLQRSRNDQQAHCLQELSHMLLSSFDLPDLMTALARELPRLGLPFGAIALHQFEADNVKGVPEHSRLLMAYCDGRRLDNGVRDTVFRSRDLLPEGLFPFQFRYTLLVMPLYFQEVQLGFALFAPGLETIGMYIALQHQISSALQGALLLRQLQERSAEMSRQKYILDAFMANVPDSIYFKDRDGRIIHSNRAHAAGFGLEHPEDVQGKTDFDFFPEEEARSKLEQEQEIIRSGKSLLDHTEPNPRGGWGTTTKMPLRDEHGEIIGTFGISFDISELKETQHQLEQANREIQCMHERLKEENLRMGVEVKVARRIRQMLFPPPQDLQTLEYIDVAAYMGSTDEVGSDYYHTILHQSRLYLGIGEFDEPGLESGIITLMTQTAMRALLEYGERDLPTFVNVLKRTISQNLQRMGIKKPLNFVLLECDGGIMKLVGLHENILILRNSGRVERVGAASLGGAPHLSGPGFSSVLPERERNSPPGRGKGWVNTREGTDTPEPTPNPSEEGSLAASPRKGPALKGAPGKGEEMSGRSSDTVILLEPGEGIVLYTDAIPEAENSAGKRYGFDRFCEIFARHRSQTAEQLKQAAIADLRDFIAEEDVPDDTIVLVLKHQPGRLEAGEL